MYRAPRGTQDILPQEQPYWRYVEQKAAEICRLYGYERIDLPMFEDARLFTRGVGEGTDIVEKEMYVFEDRGGNSLTLKPPKPQKSLILSKTNTKTYAISITRFRQIVFQKTMRS